MHRWDNRKTNQSLLRTSGKALKQTCPLQMCCKLLFRFPPQIHWWSSLGVHLHAPARCVLIYPQFVRTRSVLQIPCRDGWLGPVWDNHSYQPFLINLQVFPGCWGLLSDQLPGSGFGFLVIFQGPLKSPRMADNLKSRDVAWSRSL